MSWCRNGGRDVCERPDKTYDHAEPIRGKTVFTDGTELPFTFSRRTQGGGTRAVDHFESDGTRYEPISCTRSPETGTESGEGETVAQERRERPQTTGEGGAS